ncbi:hypothetical protein L9F63_016507 [Diploptera punctata]|uniref:BEACH domain-containing protein n=1 Tax=Diploptera punctata TaxID=6984 RepID=A0AAD8A1Y5_DIPPU|nr:hypothetical protein L9F63_016507 [Diploptera punctata]
MDTFNIAAHELGIPSKYIKLTAKDRVVIVVHKTWIRSLLKNQQIPEFIYHDSLSEDEVAAYLHQDEDFGSTWLKLYVKVVRKQSKKVIPLPRARTVTSKSEPDLSFAQLLHYVSQTNHKNLWKEAFKKYLCDAVSAEGKGNPKINLVKYDTVMRDIISRTYGCPIICMNCSTAGETGMADNKLKSYEVHSNILPAVCALEMNSYFLILHQPYIPHTLQDCVTFSPAMLGTSYAKPLFIIYQLLQAMRTMHDRGLVLGDVTLNDILIKENLWVQILPQLEDNIHDKPKTEKRKNSMIFKEITQSKHEEEDNDDIDDEENLMWSRVDLEELCKMWVYGQISNFDYLTALNHMAGRRYGDPTCHHVMPWVTDFSSQTGGNWRDLSRSKFRLNKGDHQLDLTYDTTAGTSQVPHHVSDILSEITYYVYLSRRTPRSILCKYVRTNWVPAEYPSSIQRLQEWTPDECIPEFYTDPTVFESIHDDLPDLEIPNWASSTQDFIDKHRKALESVHVSERLHHWIDLTFGYKLSGSAAVKSKNVCLQLVDSTQA